MMHSYDRRFKEAADLPWSEAVFSTSGVPHPGQLRNAPGVTFFHAPLIIGSPEPAIKEIERYRQETRLTHLVMCMQLAGLEPQKARRSRELFAKEVMPHFRH